MKMRMYYAVLVLFFLLVGTAFADNRVSVEGRDVLLDSQPYVPHGMVHVPENQFRALQKIGINSIHVDLPFNLFDPQKSEEVNRAAYAKLVAKANECTSSAKVG